MRLSVLIPLYDGAATIERTLHSLRRIADPAAVEVVVVDDGSRDDGPARARAALERLGLGGAQVLAQPNGGSSTARNRALASARGEWVFFLDADDELAADPMPLLADAPAQCTAILAACLAVRADRVVLRYRPARMAGARARRRLSAGNPLPICGALLRRAAIEAPFDPELRYLEDWDFFLRNLAAFAYPVRRPEVVLARIHLHGGNKSAHYAAIGRSRERIAAAQLAASGLGAFERNNWRLQRAIGRRLQGEALELGPLLAIPCDPVLYAKFGAHALLGRRLLAFDPYAHEA